MRSGLSSQNNKISLSTLSLTQILNDHFVLIQYLKQLQNSKIFIQGIKNSKQKEKEKGSQDRNIQKQQRQSKIYQEKLLELLKLIDEIQKIKKIRIIEIAIGIAKQVWKVTEDIKVFKNQQDKESQAKFEKSKKLMDKLNFVWNAFQFVRLTILSGSFFTQIIFQSLFAPLFYHFALSSSFETYRSQISKQSSLSQSKSIKINIKQAKQLKQQSVSISKFCELPQDSFYSKKQSQIQRNLVQLSLSIKHFSYQFLLWVSINFPNHKYNTQFKTLSYFSIILQQLSNQLSKHQPNTINNELLNFYHQILHHTQNSGFKYFSLKHKALYQQKLRLIIQSSQITLSNQKLMISFWLQYWSEYFTLNANSFMKVNNSNGSNKIKGKGTKHQSQKHNQQEQMYLIQYQIVEYMILQLFTTRDNICISISIDTLVEGYLNYESGYDWATDFKIKKQSLLQRILKILTKSLFTVQIQLIALINSKIVIRMFFMIFSTLRQQAKQKFQLINVELEKSFIIFFKLLKFASNQLKLSIVIHKEIQQRIQSLYTNFQIQQCLAQYCEEFKNSLLLSHNLLLSQIRINQFSDILNYLKQQKISKYHPYNQQKYAYFSFDIEQKYNVNKIKGINIPKLEQYNYEFARKQKKSYDNNRLHTTNNKRQSNTQLQVSYGQIQQINEQNNYKEDSWNFDQKNDKTQIKQRQQLNNSSQRNNIKQQLGNAADKIYQKQLSINSSHNNQINSNIVNNNSKLASKISSKIVLLNIQNKQNKNNFISQISFMPGLFPLKTIQQISESSKQSASNKYARSIPVKSEDDQEDLLRQYRLKQKRKEIEKCIIQKMNERLNYHKKITRKLKQMKTEDKNSQKLKILQNKQSQLSGSSGSSYSIYNDDKLKSIINKRIKNKEYRRNKETSPTDPDKYLSTKQYYGPMEMFETARFKDHYDSSYLKETANFAKSKKQTPLHDQAQSPYKKLVYQKGITLVDSKHSVQHQQSLLKRSKQSNNNLKEANLLNKLQKSKSQKLFSMTQGQDPQGKASTLVVNKSKEQKNLANIFSSKIKKQTYFTQQQLQYLQDLKRNKSPQQNQYNIGEEKTNTNNKNKQVPRKMMINTYKQIYVKSCKELKENEERNEELRMRNKKNYLALNSQISLENRMVQENEKTYQKYYQYESKHKIRNQEEMKIKYDESSEISYARNNQNQLPMYQQNKKIQQYHASNEFPEKIQENEDHAKLKQKKVISPSRSGNDNFKRAQGKDENYEYKMQNKNQSPCYQYQETHKKHKKQQKTNKLNPRSQESSCPLQQFSTKACQGLPTKVLKQLLVVKNELYSDELMMIGHVRYPSHHSSSSSNDTINKINNLKPQLTEKSQLFINISKQFIYNQLSSFRNCLKIKQRIQKLYKNNIKNNPKDNTKSNPKVKQYKKIQQNNNYNNFEKNNSNTHNNAINTHNKIKINIIVQIVQKQNLLGLKFLRQSQSQSQRVIFTKIIQLNQSISHDKCKQQQQNRKGGYLRNNNNKNNHSNSQLKNDIQNNRHIIFFGDKNQSHNNWNQHLIDLQYNLYNFNQGNNNGNNNNQLIVYDRQFTKNSKQTIYKQEQCNKNPPHNKKTNIPPLSKNNKQEQQSIINQSNNSSNISSNNSSNNQSNLIPLFTHHHSTQYHLNIKLLIINQNEQMKEQRCKQYLIQQKIILPLLTNLRNMIVVDNLKESLRLLILLKCRQQQKQQKQQKQNQSKYKLSNRKNNNRNDNKNNNNTKNSTLIYRMKIKKPIAKQQRINSIPSISSKIIYKLTSKQWQQLKEQFYVIIKDDNTINNKVNDNNFKYNNLNKLQIKQQLLLQRLMQQLINVNININNVNNINNVDNNNNNNNYINNNYSNINTKYNQKQQNYSYYKVDNNGNIIVNGSFQLIFWSCNDQVEVVNGNGSNKVNNKQSNPPTPTSTPSPKQTNHIKNPNKKFQTTRQLQKIKTISWQVRVIVQMLSSNSNNWNNNCNNNYKDIRNNQKQTQKKSSKRQHFKLQVSFYNNSNSDDQDIIKQQQFKEQQKQKQKDKQKQKQNQKQHYFPLPQQKQHYHKQRQQELPKNKSSSQQNKKQIQNQIINKLSKQLIIYFIKIFKRFKRQQRN